MAAVLDALASYVSRMLTDIVKDEVGMLLGVSGEIKNLEGKLHSLVAFLADAERKRITDEHVQGWVGKLKNVMYDATDIMDLCQLEAMKRRQESVPKCFFLCLRNPVFAHNIGRRIRELNQCLDNIKKDAEVFNFINLASYEDHRRVAPHLAIQKTAPGIDRSAVVGEIEENTRLLVDMLVKEDRTNTKSNSNIKVVAIVGVGGIGKTTLAQMIFNNETIKDKFDIKIWLSINKDFDEAELLQTAIVAAGGNHHGHKELSLLQPTLITTLEGKKIFLVMDDVWSDRVWNDFLRVPLANAADRGSGILVTTRDARVARGMKAMHPYHHVNKLEPEDAWCLLKNQVGSLERVEIVVETLKNTGLEIVKRCDGLPLAIKAIGGLLSQRSINKGEWEKVLKNPSWLVKGFPEDVHHALYLSYEDLIPPLKQCFMHISLFSRKTEIHRAMVANMWISEGFIHGSSNEQEELGKEYFNELLLRNLIEPDHKYAEKSACTMHDAVRSFAHYISRDEALAFHEVQSNFNVLDSVKIRHLSIEIKGSGSNKLDWSAIQKQKSLRTLILDGRIMFTPHDSLSSFSSLRTLYIVGARIGALVDSLCELKHLRFLRLVSTDISRLPEGIDKMKFLQYIILRNYEKLVQIPSTILKLGQLRCLDFTDTQLSGVPRGFGGLTNLKEILGFPAHMDTNGASSKQKDWCSLEELGTLSQLKWLELNKLENVSASFFATKARLASKEHLTTLKLACTRIRLPVFTRVFSDAISWDNQQIEDIFDELFPPPCLASLSIKGYFGCRLPRWMMFPTSAEHLKGLKSLFLQDLACCTQLSDGLCEIPFLEFIQIDRAPAIKHVGPTFVQAKHYHHRHCHTSRRLLTFPRLHKLLFLDMEEWEEWEWEAKANVQTMPLLDVLLIHRCKLRCVPPGLTFHATSLRKLEVSEVEHLNSLDSFTSVTDLEVEENDDLVRIVDFPMLQKLSITGCPKLKVLEGMPELISLKLKDYYMDTIPEYLREVKVRRLELDCSLCLLTSLTLMNTGPEWGKISHIKQMKAYAKDGDRKRGWYLLYKGDPSSIETNIRQSSDSEEDT
ncbi:unnamed protein product [Urochloa decumbens]|uniref:Disease resistance protein RGA3 n=1 Tax=Urochloa decumbens TaxID=240449 RepID=A0ABC8W006_9POAL